jgi:Uncharacterized protein conserved in bacteria
MKILVDADACPVVVKDILVRAAERTATQVIFVANQFIKTPPSQYISSLQVQSGFDVADEQIVNMTDTDDLIITSDIPLAAEIIDKGALALSPRGELFTVDNVKSRLNIRDFLETMRSSGIQSGGQAPFGQLEKQKFANQLDRWLAKGGK